MHLRHCPLLLGNLTTYYTSSRPNIWLVIGFHSPAFGSLLVDNCIYFFFFVAAEIVQTFWPPRIAQNFFLWEDRGLKVPLDSNVCDNSAKKEKRRKYATRYNLLIAILLKVRYLYWLSCDFYRFESCICCHTENSSNADEKNRARGAGFCFSDIIHIFERSNLWE